MKGRPHDEISATSTTSPYNSAESDQVNLYARLTTAELLQSLMPGQPGSLKARDDGTILDGHHRIETLRQRGIDVDQLPREVLLKNDQT